MNQEAVAVWNLINTGGMVFCLFFFLWLMLKGEMLPRRVYEDLTKRILEELCQKVIDGIRTVIREEVPRRERED